MSDLRYPPPLQPDRDDPEPDAVSIISTLGADDASFVQAEEWQMSQGSAQSETSRQPAADAALVSLHAQENEAAEMQVDHSSSNLLEGADRALSLSSFQESMSSLSQGDPTDSSAIGHANSNGVPRARAKPLPMPMEDEEKETDDSDEQEDQDNDTHAHAAASRSAPAAAAAASPRPLVSIALQPSPSLRLPPRASWTADANRLEAMLRGRNRAGQLTTAQTTPLVQPPPQPARPVAAASPVPSSSRLILGGRARYTPLPGALPPPSCRFRLRESNVASVTGLWRDYLAKTDPHTDSPISCILKQVAEQIDWILDCLQTELEKQQQAESCAQQQIALDALTDKQIMQLLNEHAPKQIHVVLKHNMDRIMAFSTQFARFLSLSPGRSYHELALVSAFKANRSMSTCLPVLRPSKRYCRPTGEVDAARLRQRSLDLKSQGVENQQCLRNAIMQLIGDPADALATNSALMTLRRAAYAPVHSAYFAPDSECPIASHHVRVMHRLMPDPIVARTVNPHKVQQQWTSFSGRVVGLSEVSRVRADPRTDRRGWFRDIAPSQLVDVPVQIVWIRMQPLDDAFIGGHRAAHPPWQLLSPLPAVPVEIEGELVGQFARGDRVVGYGFVRVAADFAVRMKAHPRVRDRPPMHAEDLDGPPANIMIQANNLVHTNSQEWIESNAFDCANELRARFANVADATQGIPCNPGARDWIITALLIDSVFRGEVPSAHYKLLRLQMLLSLVSGPGPLEQEQEDRFYNDEELEYQASLQGAQAQDQWAILKASLQRSQPLRDSDLLPLTMLILSGGPLSSKAVPELVDLGATAASDCTGAASRVQAPLRPTRVLSQTDPLFHSREARDALRDEWTLLDVQGRSPLRPGDVGLIRSLLMPVQANAAPNGMGRGRKKQQRTNQQLTLELDSRHTIPPARTPPFSPPHLWVSAPLSDHPKSARAAANRADGLATPQLPLTQDEIEASRMFDFTVYQHAGEEETKLCAENIFKRYLLDANSTVWAEPADAPRKPSGLFAAQVSGDPHWKGLHEWISDARNFRKYISAARSSKLPRMTAEALALLQNYFNFAVNRTAMAGRVQEVYNAQFNDLARRVAVSHARLHLRRDVNTLDMTVGLMLAEEQAATVHADVARATRWNRAERMFGAFSIEEMPRKPQETYCMYTLSTFNKLFNAISHDAATHVHTPRSARSGTLNPSATPGRAPPSSGVYTDLLGSMQQPSPQFPQAGASFQPSPITYGSSPAPLQQIIGMRNQHPGSSHHNQSAWH